jgi:acyl-CoA synthetase (AMP-forming)/AMP-acid ligase II
VWPQAVETVLATHPAVRDVAVAGRPDAEWGEVVVAYVVTGDDPPSLGDLRDHVKASMPSFNAPRVLVIVDEIPRTTLGKIVRNTFATGIS